MQKVEIFDMSQNIESSPFIPKKIGNLTIEQLLDESKSESKVYPVWWSLTYYLVRNMTQGWPMTAFRFEEIRDTQNCWSPEALHDITSEVICLELIEHGQQDYILGIVSDAVTNSDNEQEDPNRHVALVKYFLKQQINKVLDHRRAPTLTGNLISRLREIFDASRVHIVEKISELDQSALETDQLVKRVASLLRTYPRFPNTGDERLSRLYETADLKLFAEQLYEFAEKLAWESLKQAIESTLTGMSGSITALEATYRTDSLQNPDSPDQEESWESGTTNSLSRSYAYVTSALDEPQLDSDAPMRARGGVQSERVLLEYSRQDMDKIHRILDKLDLREQKFLILQSDPDKDWNQTQVAEILGLPARKYVKGFVEVLAKKINEIFIEAGIEGDDRNYFMGGMLCALGVKHIAIELELE
jgi:hypothetical protein